MNKPEEIAKLEEAVRWNKKSLAETSWQIEKMKMKLQDLEIQRKEAETYLILNINALIERLDKQWKE